MKNLLYFVLFTFVFSACQKEETTELIPKTAWTQDIEIPTEIDLTLADVKTFHAAIILETEKGEDTFNEISLANHPEAWIVNHAGQVIPNKEVISKLLDYVSISKHNEKPVISQKIAVFKPGKVSEEDRNVRFQCNRSFYEAAVQVCFISSRACYLRGEVISIKPCYSGFQSCIAYDYVNKRYMILACGETNA